MQKMKINYWLLKSEPETWSWDNQVKEGASMWDGVRNYQARNNLKKMKKMIYVFSIIQFQREVLLVSLKW